MRTIAIIASLSALLAQAACAQPAIYRDDALAIPHGAVVTGDGEGQYYADIVLRQDGAGGLLIAEADAKPLVAVDSVDVLLLESFPLQVQLAVEGYKSVPCVTLLPPAVSRAGDTFTVLLAESELGPAESCIAIIDPFSITIPLDVLGMEAGDYRVLVNGVEAGFTLQSDNGPSPQP